MMRAHLALLVVTLIYGLFYVAIKILVNDITPWETFILRLLIATPLFFVLEKLFYNTRFASFKELLQVGGLGLLGVTLVQLTIVFGLKYTSVFHTGFIVGMAPLMTLLISVGLKQERLNLPKLAGILIAFAGLVLLLSLRTSADHLPKTFLLGDALVFLNILMWSFYLILSRPLLHKYPAFTVTSYGFVLSGLVTLPFMLLTLKRAPWAALSQEGWLWMGFVVIFCTIVTYFLNYYALARLVASTVAVYVFLQPICTALFAHFVLKEPITSAMIGVGLIILMGVAIATESYRPVTRYLLKRSA